LDLRLSSHTDRSVITDYRDVISPCVFTLKAGNHYCPAF